MPPIQVGEQVQKHIDYLELKAASLAMQSFLKDKSNMAMLIRSDNHTAIAYVNKMGSPTRSHPYLLSLRDLGVVFGVSHNTTCRVLGRKGQHCWESHHHDSSDWQLLPSVFKVIKSLLCFIIDLFASRTNAQLPVYCSWRPDPQARKVDAFSISWSKECPHMFPPST